MAHVQQSRRPRKHHHPATAAQITRAEPGRKHLAVHEGQLALKPRLQVLRRYRRPLLLRLENTPGPTMEDHVDRQTQMGTRVLINDDWYQAWLPGQQQISIVARDRGGAYALAAAKALPDTTQVADLWHLMENAIGHSSTPSANRCVRSEQRSGR